MQGIIQLVISAANLRLMGWVIAMAGFSIITVEDKFDPNQLIYFRYIFMLWCVGGLNATSESCKKRRSMAQWGL